MASVNPSNLRFYGSANMPDVDGATTGGAVDFTTKIFFDDITPNGLMDYVSSSASDTAATITITGRDATGVIVTETKTLTGTTPVNGSQTFERLLKGAAGGTTAVGDIAAISHTPLISAHTAQAGSANSTGTTPALMKLQAGDGATAVPGTIIRTASGTGPNQIRQVIDNTSYGTDIVAVSRDWGTVPDATTTYNVHHGFLFDLSPNQITKIRRPFYNAAADVAGGSNRTYYEKVFAVNDNTGTALTQAAISKQADPSGGTLQLALTTALNDTGTVVNRQTAPGTGIGSFTTGAAPQSLNVPGAQNLPSGAAPNSGGAQGIWLSLLLTAGLAPAKTSFKLRSAGQTT